jgi:hypothetical protein
MKRIIAYIPPAIAVIPTVVYWIWHALFYKGCMDGFMYFYAALVAFVIGGALNLLFLLGSGISCLRSVPSNGIFTRQSLVVSAFTVVFQLLVLGFYLIPMYLRG